MQNSKKCRRVLFPMEDVCTSANLKFFRPSNSHGWHRVKSQYARGLQSIQLQSWPHHHPNLMEEEANWIFEQISANQIRIGCIISSSPLLSSHLKSMYHRSTKDQWPWRIFSSSHYLNDEDPDNDSALVPVWWQADAREEAMTIGAESSQRDETKVACTGAVSRPTKWFLLLMSWFPVLIIFISQPR